MPFRHGKLFRLSRAGSEPSYVFATLHLPDPRIMHFSPRLRAALKSSKIVALESIETGEVLRRAIAKNSAAWRRATVARADQRASLLLSKADFATLEALVAKRGLPKSIARTFKPSTLALLLDLPSCAIRKPGGKPYVDQLIANLARENNIATVGLEPMIEQIDFPDELPPDDDRAILIAILRQADCGEDFIATAIARYIDGDIGLLLAWTRSPQPFPGVTAFPPAFFDQLITRRNHLMHDRALPLVSRGGAFIAVGATHLPGTEGLLSLFARDGFKIEAIE